MVRSENLRHLKKHRKSSVNIPGEVKGALEIGPSTKAKQNPKRYHWYFNLKGLLKNGRNTGVKRWHWYL